MIMMYAGLRRGKLIPLEWADIDLSAKTISVNKAIEIVKGKSISKDTAKSQCSIRIIDIPQRLTVFLTIERKNDGITEENEHSLVCKSAKGKMLSGSTWKRLWKAYWNALNLKYGDFTQFKKEQHRNRFCRTGIHPQPSRRSSYDPINYCALAPAHIYHADVYGWC